MHRILLSSTRERVRARTLLQHVYIISLRVRDLQKVNKIGSTPTVTMHEYTASRLCTNK